jgi:hypothetical protein
MKRFLWAIALLLLAGTPCTYAHIDIAESRSDFMGNFNHETTQGSADQRYRTGARATV